MKKEEKKSEKKCDNYIPVDNPTVNSVYELIKWYETEILHLVAYTIPDKELREYMDTIRGKLKDISCKNCGRLGRTVQNRRTINILEKDDDLSEKYGILCETEKEPIKLVKVLTERVVDRVSMACEGCRALRNKQIATGYIKNRRFKQV